MVFPVIVHHILMVAVAFGQAVAAAETVVRTGAVPAALLAPAFVAGAAAATGLVAIPAVVIAAVAAAVVTAAERSIKRSRMTETYA